MTYDISSKPPGVCITTCNLDYHWVHIFRLLSGSEDGLKYLNNNILETLLLLECQSQSRIFRAWWCTWWNPIVWSMYVFILESVSRRMCMSVSLPLRMALMVGHPHQEIWQWTCHASEQDKHSKYFVNALRFHWGTAQKGNTKDQSPTIGVIKQCTA